MIIQAIIALIIFLATPGSASALSRDDLVCPVRNDWKEGSDECPCQRDWKPLPEQLKRIPHQHWKDWIKQKGLDQAARSKPILCNADLRRANLQGADLSFANLQGADLNHANLSGAILLETNLRGADLYGANLADAKLISTHIDDPQLAFTNLTSATYMPVGLPQRYVTGIKGLGTVITGTTYAPESRVAVSALVHLRELLQQSGLRDEEREVTFAIEHSKTNYDLRLWKFQFLRAVEGSLRLVLFEWITDYGLRPFRALQILLALVVVFALGVYVPALLKGGRIYRIWPSGRLESTASGATLSNESKVETLHPQSFLAAVGYALQFSLLSAFQIGWRELNVGSWIARLHRREYILKAEGWVRTLAGIQSLISVSSRDMGSDLFRTAFSVRWHAMSAIGTFRTSQRY